MTIKPVNILDLIDYAGEGFVKTKLSSFSCTKNSEIEDYLKNDAIDFAQKGLSITYLVFGYSGDTSYLLGYFTLTYKIIQISRGSISRTTEKKIARFGDYDQLNSVYTIPAPLIAQFGKNSSPMPDSEIKISGDDLMSLALDQIQYIQSLVGGRVVYLECEDNPFLLDFYFRNGYVSFSKRYTDEENDVPFYHQLLKVLK